MESEARRGSKCAQATNQFSSTASHIRKEIRTKAEKRLLDEKAEKRKAMLKNNYLSRKNETLASISYPNPRIEIYQQRQQLKN